jgi:UDP-N-acetylmuramoyl-L-alanyl-D-glutamate--2,6-diaminopimelate ligase
MKLLKEILFGVDLVKLVGDPNTAITELVFDSRKVGKMSCFVAVRGTQADGHDYIQTAIDAGASAIVCEEWGQDAYPDGVAIVEVQSSQRALGLMANNYYDNPSHDLKIIGVTGTNGKTTCVTLLFDLFHQLGEKCGLLSTVENRIGKEVIKATHTTPDAISIQAMLARMRKEEVRFVFMEVSSHAVAQDRITGVQFMGGVFTNLTRDHLDYHGTFKDYIEAKKGFFDQLPSKAFALVNADDSNGAVMVQNTKAKKRSYSLRSLGDYHTKVLESRFSGSCLRINNQDVFTNLVGRFNAYNLLAVYAVGIELGFDSITLLTAISLLKPVEGRFEYFQTQNNVTAIVDYAHTPDALKNVLASIAEIRTGNEVVWTVVGCGGNRDKGKRPEMAKAAGENSDKIILTSDNPRFEKPGAILKDMQAGIEPHLYTKYISIEDRREAIKAACFGAKPGDIILVAGKGHENYQEIEGERLPFDDRDELELTFRILGQL